MNVRVGICPAIKTYAVVAACGLASLGPPAASAPRCGDIVRAFLMSVPAELLSVKAKRDGCLVTYLMHSEGKRPVRVTRELRSDEVGLVQAERKSSSAQMADETKVP